MPLYAIRRTNAAAKEFQRSDAVVLSADLINQKNLKLLGAIKWTGYANLPIDTIVKDGGTWYSVPGLLPASRAISATVDSRYNRKVGWPATGTIELIGSFTRTVTSMPAISTANTFAYLDPWSLRIQSKYTSGPMQLSLTLEGEPARSIVKGPNYVEIANSRIMSSLTLGWKLNNSWSATFNMADFISQSQRQESRFEDGVHMMTSVFDTPNSPTFSVFLTRVSTGK